MPAMFIRMRAGPCAAAALSSAASTLSVSVMSQAQATPPISAATFSRQLGVDVEHGDLGAQPRQFARGGFAEARGAAGDERGLSLDVHGVSPSAVGQGEGQACRRAGPRPARRGA